MGELAFGEATYEGSLSTLGVLLATFLGKTGPNTKQQRRVTRWGTGAALGTATFDADNTNSRPQARRRGLRYHTDLRICEL